MLQLSFLYTASRFSAPFFPAFKKKSSNWLLYKEKEIAVSLNIEKLNNQDEDLWHSESADVPFGDPKCHFYVFD